MEQRRELRLQYLPHHVLHLQQPSQTTVLVKEINFVIEPSAAFQSTPVEHLRSLLCTIDAR